MERFKFNFTDITDLGYLQIDMFQVVDFCSNYDYTSKIQCATKNVKIMKKFMRAQFDWEDVSMEWGFA